LQKFEKRHNIKFLELCGDKASVEHKGMGKFIEEDTEEHFNIDNEVPVAQSLNEEKKR
jgi:hypothetical protein